jgi:5'-phosphate synthase pdxT subunit
MQGGIEEHLRVFSRIGVDAHRVKTQEHIALSDGFIFPGGESTAMIKLIETNGLEEPLRKRIVEEKVPVYGSCAGMVLLSRRITNYPQQKTLGFMDIEVCRNAFGRQLDSFEEDLVLEGWGGNPIRAIFIRAPIIERRGPQVQILAKSTKGAVMAVQDQMLVTSFHPELTGDYRVHHFFLGMVEDWLSTHR